MGKTGLIRHIYASEEIAGRYNTFFVDILHTTSLRELAFAISKEVFTALKPQGKKILDEFLTMFRSLNLSLEYNPASGLPEFSLHLGEREIIDSSIDLILQSNSISYRELLSTLKDKQKQVLVAIAKEGSAGEVTSGDFIWKYSLPTASSIQNALRKLTECEIVHRDDNAYTVYDKFLALWLKETY